MYLTYTIEEVPCTNFVYEQLFISNPKQLFEFSLYVQQAKWLKCWERRYMLLLILTYHDIPGTMCSLDGSFWQPFSSTVVHDVTISCSKESTLLLIGVTPKPVELKEIKNCSIGLKIFYKIYTIDPIHAAAIFQLLPPKPRSHNN